MDNPVKNSLGGPQLGFSQLNFGFDRSATQDHDQLSRLNSASFMDKKISFTTPLAAVPIDIVPVVP